MVGSNFKKTLKLGVARHLDRLGIIRRRRNGLVILTLHKVNGTPDALGLTLSPGLLESVIREVQQRHEIVSLAELESDHGLEIGAGLKFAFTFDDGYRDNYEHAFPLLSRYRVPATIYLSVDHIDGKRTFWYERLASAVNNSRAGQLDLLAEGIGRYPVRDQSDRQAALTMLNRLLKRHNDETREHLLDVIAERLGAPLGHSLSPMLTWDMIKEMAAGNITFGSHTLSHPILSKETIERVQAELRGSKDVLERTLARRITSFAYPNGAADDFNAEVVAEVKRAGYRHACTTLPGINDPASDPLLLRRVNLHNGMCTDRDGKFSPPLFWAKALCLF